MSRYFYFLHAFKLPSALIAQGLAEKNTGAKRGWFFSSQPPKGRSPCPIKGGRLPLQV